MKKSTSWATDFINNSLDYLASESGKRFLMLCIGIVLGYFLAFCKWGYEVMGSADESINEYEMNDAGQ